MWHHLSALSGHLSGPVASALVDGQLDAEASERAWGHVLHCPSCRRLVEREGWAKRQVRAMATRPLPHEQAPAHLIGSLFDLQPEAGAAASTERERIEAWTAVEELEQRGRGRRRAGIALVGAGSVSAAVLGISALSGAPLGIGAAPTSTPATTLSRGASTTSPTRAVVAPTSPSGVVHGRLPGWTLTRDAGGVAHAVPVIDATH